MAGSKDSLTKAVNFHLEQFKQFEYQDFDHALAHLDTAKKLSVNISDQLTLGYTDMYTGWYFQDISNYDSAEVYFFKALDHYTTANNYNEIANAYGNIGNIYLDKGQLEKSLDYQLKSVQVNDAILLFSDNESWEEAARRGRAYAWSNIANIYALMDEDEKAINYEMNALSYELDHGDSLGRNRI